MSRKTREKERALRKAPGFLKGIALAGAIALSAGLIKIYTLDRGARGQFPSYQQVASFERVDSVIDHRGEVPDVVVLLQEHADQSYDEGGVSPSTENIEAITGLCNKLYDDFGVRTLLPEGLEPAFEIDYRTNKQIHFRRYNSKGYLGKLENLINGRNWTLKSGEDPNNQAGLEKLTVPLREVYNKVKSDVQNNVKNIAKRYPVKMTSEEESQFKSEINIMLGEANNEIRTRVNSFLDSERTQKLYDLMITKRDERYAQICKDAKREHITPIILVYGSAHYKTLPQHLDNMNYVVIRPKGIEKLTPVTPEGLRERYYWKFSAK